jgi:hypothetical protein
MTGGNITSSTLNCAENTKAATTQALSLIERYAFQNCFKDNYACWQRRIRADRSDFEGSFHNT